jgi:hypothetical protein
MLTQLQAPDGSSIGFRQLIRALCYQCRLLWASRRINSSARGAEVAHGQAWKEAWNDFSSVFGECGGFWGASPNMLKTFDDVLGADDPAAVIMAWHERRKPFAHRAL